MRVTGKSNPPPGRDSPGSVAAGYVSPLILRSLRERPGATIPWIERVRGTLLMADISGFTAMSEKLAETGREGAELLTDIINRYFTAMIDAARVNQGHNLKFGGDALLMFFDGEGHEERAALTALRMQRANRRQSAVRIGGERHKPSVSIGIHSGEFWSAAVGQPEFRLQHLLFGDDVNGVVAAEAAANAGEIVATTSTLASKPWDVQPRDSMFLLKGVQARTSPSLDQTSELLPDNGADLRPYLAPPVLWALQAGRSDVAGEHRNVVVLFIHATGPEDLLFAEGSGAALKALQDYTSELVALTERYGGFLAANDIYTEGVKFIVVFGAPIAREDDPANASRLALALDDWLKASGHSLRHRIGINGGFAFAGDIGAPYRREYTVMGDCVNVAARLMSAAESGQILISTSTAQTAGAGFIERELAPLRVKGKTEAIGVRELLGIDYSAEPGASNQTPLFGRTEELERLRRACLNVELGAGAALLLKGDPGIGKSRLLEELRQYASARGWSVFAARCQGHTSGIPFAPWSAILRSLFDIEDGDAPDDANRRVTEELERLCPDRSWLASLLNPLIDLTLPDSPAVQALDEEGKGLRLYELVSAIVCGMAADSAILITIDDVDKSDEGSMEMARRVQADSQGSAVMVCLTERLPGRRTAGAHGRALMLGIPPLDEDDAARMVRHCLGASSVQTSVLNLILDKAQGNPLFIEEVSRSVREHPGMIARLQDGDDGAFSDLQRILPDRLQNLIMARIDRLDPELREALKVAAIIGSGISVDALSTGLQTVSVKENAGSAIQRLMREELLQADGSGGYGFTHALAQEVAYESVSFRLRRAIHGGVARHVEATTDDVASVYEMLAYHFDRSGDKPKTLDYSLLAGDKARGLFANDDAIRYYRRGSAVAGELDTDPELQARVSTSLGDVLDLTGRHKPAIAAYVVALGAWLGSRLGRTADARALDLGKMARRRGPNRRRPAAAVCRKIGFAYERLSDYARALAWFEGSIAASPANDGAGRGAANMGIAGTLYRAGRYDEAEEWAVKGLRSLAATSATSQLARAHNIIGVVYRDQGRVRKAIGHRLKALSAYEGLGDVMGQADTLNNLGLDYFSSGQWPNAVQRFQKCLETAEMVGDAELIAIARNNLGEVYLVLGDVDRAKAECRWAAAAAARIGNPALEGLAEANVGEALMLEGRLPEAREILRNSGRAMRRIGAGTLALEADIRLAEVHLASGEATAASALAGKVLEASKKADSPPIEGRALRLLGVLAARRKRPDEAESLLRESIALFAAAGSAHGEAKSRLALGLALGDKTEARKALRAFQRLGAARDAGEAEGLLAA